MDNLSIFNVEEENALSNSYASVGNALDVVKLDFVEAKTVGWQDLFSGLCLLMVDVSELCFCEVLCG